MNWIITVLALAVIGFILDREIYFYEGAHLGPRLQAWLYDRWSRRYDEGKRSSQLQDDEMLAQPLLEALHAADISEPLILDFATGTGRLSSAILNQAEFKGRIIALDLSLGMLEQAASKLSALDGQVEFLRHVSLPLPFPDEAFDAVCALEVLELFPTMEEPLRELTRVLRPAGILLSSRGTEESGRTAKVKSPTEFASLLEINHMEKIRITKWWKLFDRVLAVKHGSSRPVLPKDLSQILKCSSCHSMHWSRGPNRLKCLSCGRGLSITKDGIVLN